jgi:hypothetical protein
MGAKGAAAPTPTGQTASSAPTEQAEAPKVEEAPKPEEKDLTGDLDQFAPLEAPANLFGAKAVVWRGEISFRVKLRDGAAKPAEEGAKP